MTAAPPKRRGRPKTTGRYETREELCRTVWQSYLGTTLSAAAVARQARVSHVTVLKILNSQEGKP